MFLMSFHRSYPCVLQIIVYTDMGRSALDGAQLHYVGSASYVLKERRRLLGYRIFLFKLEITSLNH